MALEVGANKIRSRCSVCCLVSTCFERPGLVEVCRCVCVVGVVGGVWAWASKKLNIKEAKISEFLRGSWVGVGTGGETNFKIERI